METLYGRLVDIISVNERFVEYLIKEKERSEKSFANDVRVAAASEITNFVADMSVINIELADLKKTRKTDEKKIRQGLYLSLNK